MLGLGFGFALVRLVRTFSLCLLPISYSFDAFELFKDMMCVHACAVLFGACLILVVFEPGLIDPTALCYMA